MNNIAVVKSTRNLI